MALRGQGPHGPPDKRRKVFLPSLISLTLFPDIVGRRTGRVAWWMARIPSGNIVVEI